MKARKATVKRRKATVKRRTRETDIAVQINLDGSGKSRIRTGLAFLDHMLELLAKHSLIDLTIRAFQKANMALKYSPQPVVVDLGYGRLPVTTWELAARLRTVRADVRVVGLEIDPNRVEAAVASSYAGCRSSNASTQCWIIGTLTGSGATDSPELIGLPTNRSSSARRATASSPGIALPEGRRLWPRRSSVAAQRPTA